jgi:TP901 family phage tail tape measure protein
MTFTAKIEIKIEDHTAAAMRSMKTNFSAMEKALKGMETSSAFAANLNHVADGFDKVGKAARDAIASPLKVTADLEEAMSEVRAQTFKGVMGEEQVELFKQMNAEARRLGATTSFSASDAAGAMIELATGGFEAKEQMAALAGVMDVAAAGHVEMAQAAEIGIIAINSFGLSASDAGRVGDVMVNTASNSTTSITEMAEALKYVGTVAKNAGVSLEVTNAAIGELAQVGVEGSQAGTTLRAMLLRLQAPDKKGKSALRWLGIDTRDKAGNLRPFEELLADIHNKMDRKFGKGKGGNRRAALLKAVFGEEAASGAAGLVERAGTGSFKEAIASNLAAEGTAARVAADMVNNAKGATKELDSAIEELQLSIGEQLLPAFRETVVELTSMVQGMARWASENPELTKTIALSTAALATFATVGGPVIRGVSLLVSGAGFLKVALAALSPVMALVTTAVRALGLALITNPIGLVITAVVALGAAGYALYQNWDEVKAFFIGIWDSLPGPVQSAIRLMTAPIRMLVGLAGVVVDNWDGITDFFANLWANVADITMKGLGTLVGIAPEHMQQAADAFTIPWEDVGQFFVNLWDGITAGIKSHIEWIVDQFKVIGEAIEGFERTLPEWATGRERVLGGSAAGMARKALAGPPALREGATDSLGGLASKFAGELKILIAAEPGAAVTKTEQRSTGSPGFNVNTGYQGV